MSAKATQIMVLSLLLLIPAWSWGQSSGTISYKIDGKSFSFKNGVIDYYSNDGYIFLECESIDQVTISPNNTRATTVGMSIQIVGDEKSFAGRHEADSSDTMPVHFSWYEVVPGKNKEEKELKEYMASLDSGDEKRMIMRITIESFGPEGSIIRGTFNGRLFDEEGILHEITDGRFAVPRKDEK